MLKRLLMGMAVLAVVAFAAVVVTMATTRPEGPGPAPLPALDDHAALAQAEQALIRECMRELGFEYRVSAPSTAPPRRDFPYALDDPAWAAAHGYGPAPEPPAENPNQSYYARQPRGRAEAALKAIHGDRPRALSVRVPGGALTTRSDNGCQAEAEARLYGELAEWFKAETVVRELPSLRRSRVLADPRFAAAAGSWADCMRAEGHPHATPAEARAALPLPAEAERKLAVAEAGCAVRTGFAAAATTLDREHDTRLNREFQSEVDTERRLRADAVPRARAVLAATR
ncbi:MULTISPECIES: hypothetical protein [unclassified Crossiella]|uniref:hypothetical protein n=1 Tax=unclassified Crossiella TaxID=2620835 RepID=UPI001FFF0908|nr:MULTISPECIES: hypothetical protein [unclassified Crossiella]MCK2244615.1 hypothetical protein [Crossiella sp. S99.2]MCK2258398.1 hypothetical protein [Crossiella sp. S99.1]